MQDVDRPAYIQALSEPAGAHGPRIETKPLHIIRRAEPIDRIGRHRRWRRYLRQDPTVRSPEAEGAVGLARDPVALLVDARWCRRQSRARFESVVGPPCAQ